LFESLVVRDLRVYAQALGGHVHHYRDSNGHEIDAVIEQPGGTWAACEIKLGPGAAAEAATSLQAAVDQLDLTVTGQPAFKAVITGGDLSVRRRDGIYVIPVGALRP
jgi:predicted AAA+ superfamily ATPase